MNKVWFIADTHFNHDNIIKYESRPFKNSEEMNKVLIQNWNNTVKKTDTIFVLGDFGLGKVEDLREICNQLQGRKILVMGNHDRNISTMLHIGFDEVIKYPIIYKNFWMLSHEPQYMNDCMPYVNIHGHLHSKTMQGANYYNVGVELNNYKPISFDEIVSKFVSK